MPMPGLDVTSADTIGWAAHIVQTALTPVFLLNGIGTLLALFNTRIAKVRDQVEHAADLISKESDATAGAQLRTQMAQLHRRVAALDASIVLGAVAGAATCLSVFMLFVGDVKGFDIGDWLIALFGLALACIIASLLAFLIDTLLALQGLRRDGPLPRAATSSRESA